VHGAVADEVAVHVWVTGRVQGVWYRQSCAHEALAHGVRGWARNLPDGRVEVWLEGARGDVDEVLAWCRRGPSRALVSGLTIEDVAVSGRRGFEIA
jgi:acylphosphatase